MQHLDLETLARLVDEAPEPAEAAHLRDCLACRRELAELREQTDALAGLGAVDPPDAAWASLEARLRDEGLVHAAARPRLLMLYHPPARIAAAVALFLLGGAAGAALLRGGGPERVASTGQPAAEASSSLRRPASSFAQPEVLYVSEPAPSAASTAADPNGARLAVNGTAEGPAASGAVPPVRARARRATRAEADRAARELVQAQAQYVGALQRVAAIADPASGNDPETRLAALDQLVQLTAAALERVPGDPVINGYHLAAVAERDALRRQMDRDTQTTWF